MISLRELREAYLNGKIEKKLYWQIARENYTHILPQFQKIIEENEEVQSICITKEGIVLKKRGGTDVL